MVNAYILYCYSNIGLSTCMMKYLLLFLAFAFMKIYLPSLSKASLWASNPQNIHSLQFMAKEDDVAYAKLEQQHWFVSHVHIP